MPAKKNTTTKPARVFLLPSNPNPNIESNENDPRIEIHFQEGLALCKGLKRKARLEVQMGRKDLALTVYFDNSSDSVADVATPFSQEFQFSDLDLRRNIEVSALLGDIVATAAESKTGRFDACTVIATLLAENGALWVGRNDAGPHMMYVSKPFGIQLTDRLDEFVEGCIFANTTQAKKKKVRKKHSHKKRFKRQRG